jgi:LPXTG-site transpeptidase (sortase) family protein
MELSASRRPRRWFLWGLGNVLILAGVFALLYVGGLQAYVAGRASSFEPPETPLVRQAPALRLTPTPSPSPGLPVLNWDPLEDVSPPPTASPQWHSTVTHIIIPAIGVNSTVIPVSWHVEQVKGQSMTIWDVAKYAVGHHTGSGNPGEGTNIVLAGHSGGFGAVFRRLSDLQPGDEVLLEGNGRQYLYVVEEVLFLKEVGVPMEERLRNAQYMAPTDEERITMITCWPVRVYDYRIVVRARPYRAASPFGRPDWVEH